jgi:hypothetical protein
MRHIYWVFILAFAVSGFAVRAAAEQNEMSAPSAKAFADSVTKYVKMLGDLQSSVPSQKTTKEPEQIADRQKQLAGVIANARRDAHQGDIFTPPVASEFGAIIRKAFQGTGGRAMRKTIEERDPVKPIVIKVNDVYPDSQPHTTMPPTLLTRLPVLPKDLEYRIIGHTFALQDTKTNLIVDFIPNAIP